MLRDLAKRAYQLAQKRLPPTLSAAITFARAHHRLPAIRPKTFSDYVFHRKVADDDPRFEVYADKLRVKEIVADAVGSEWVIPTLWHGDSVPEQIFQWPLPFVLKANHGSGFNLFLRSRSDLDLDAISAAVEIWSKHQWPRWMGEAWYNRIPKRLLAEPMIGDGSGVSDFKLFTFGGRVEFIQVDLDRFISHKRVFFDPEWRRHNFSLKYPSDPRPIQKPPFLREMIEAASLLGAPFTFARVDLYETAQGPRFGEITFTPGAGLERFTPRSMDLQFGRLWSEAERKKRC